MDREKRDELIARMRSNRDMRYDGSSRSEKAQAQMDEKFGRLLDQYTACLPRQLFGRCPFTRAWFRHTFDPFGLDGPWWHRDADLEIREPKVPPAYQTHLGALDLCGREPSEATREVIPGPDAPFVVPRLLRLPGMVAVLMQIDLTTGDRAWVISYWSSDQIPRARLHQPWLRPEFCFPSKLGGSSRFIANDPWDFELEPYLADGRLRWIHPEDPDQAVVSGVARCPFIGIGGHHRPQALRDGVCELNDLPDGTVVWPFEE